MSKGFKANKLFTLIHFVNFIRMKCEVMLASRVASRCALTDLSVIG